MKLLDVYEMLEAGELRQHPVFSDGLKVEDYPKVNRAIQAALVNLYSRFPLKVKELTLVMKAYVTDYELSSEYNLATNPDGYLDGGLLPFADDLLEVLSVTDEVCCELPLNNNMDCSSLFTVTTTCLRVPRPVDGGILFVSYRANHPNILPDSPTNTVLELPKNMHTLLLSYVAYRLYSGWTDPASLQKASLLLGSFEQQCMQQESFGLVNSDDRTPNMKFYSGGWV